MMSLTIGRFLYSMGGQCGGAFVKKSAAFARCDLANS